jgi:hypothetical protein
MKSLQMDKLLILGAIMVLPALQSNFEDNNYNNYEGLRDDDDRDDVYGDNYNNDQGLIQEKFEENEFGDNDYIIGSRAARVGKDEYGNYNGKKQGSTEVAAPQPYFPSGTPFLLNLILRQKCVSLKRIEHIFIYISIRNL